MNSKQALLEKVAKATDTEEFLTHIGWEAAVKPSLQAFKETQAKILVAHLLGSPLPGNITKEQIAGQIYGIDFIIKLLENILTQGQKALEILKAESGISL